MSSDRTFASGHDQQRSSLWMFGMMQLPAGKRSRRLRRYMAPDIWLPVRTKLSGQVDAAFMAPSGPFMAIMLPAQLNSRCTCGHTCSSISCLLSVFSSSRAMEKLASRLRRVDSLECWSLRRSRLEHRSWVTICRTSMAFFATAGSRSAMRMTPASLPMSTMGEHRTLYSPGSWLSAI